jgi:urease subunit gamma
VLAQVAEICATQPKQIGDTVASDFLRSRTDTRMNLVPSDAEKLLLAVAGMLARDRRDRGVKLNYPESVALLSTWVIERAREGARVDQLMSEGREVLTRNEVMEGVPEMITDVQVEATFPDGRKLVTLHQPIQ